MPVRCLALPFYGFYLVRTFNYTGHGGSKQKHVEGVDFDRTDLSINQNRPGWFSGEWHNNHHLYPNSTRAGFLIYQLDLAWIYIYGLYKLGAVSQYNDAKKEFLRNYLKPDSTAVTEKKQQARAKEENLLVFQAEGDESHGKQR